MKLSFLAKLMTVFVLSLFALGFSKPASANGFLSFQVVPTQPPVYYAPPPPPVYYAPAPGYYAQSPQVYVQPPVYAQPYQNYAQQQEEENAQSQQNEYNQGYQQQNGYLPQNGYANAYQNQIPPGFSCVVGPHYCPLRTQHPVNSPCTCPVNGRNVGGIVN